MRKTVEERFWAKVDKTDSCWVWTGATLRRGYGQIRIPVKKAKQAHRLSWEIHNGPIPDGMLVCHKCDNPPCVNPAHLFLGTQSDNNKDCVRKGRHRSWNAFKMHCKRGHPLFGENLRIDKRSDGPNHKSTKRTCRKCASINSRKQYRRVNNIPASKFRV